MKIFIIIISILGLPFIAALGVVFYLIKQDKRPDSDWQEEVENHMKWQEETNSRVS